MYQTKYAVFQWGLIHDSLRLITRLINLASFDWAFSMIEDNDYLDVKQFVNKLLELNANSDKELIATKCAILEKIITVSPRDIYRYVIAKIVAEHKARDSMVTFPQPFEEIVSELEKKYGKASSLSEQNLFFRQKKVRFSKDTEFKDTKAMILIKRIKIK